MSFARSGTRRSSTDTVVHAVGQRVYVNRLGTGFVHVDLMNDEGTTTIASLADGLEVMVVAWKPRGSTGTRYRVRCTHDGVEGWLAAANLRRTRAVASPALPSGPPAKSAPDSTASVAHDAKPRFGRR